VVGQLHIQAALKPLTSFEQQVGLVQGRCGCLGEVKNSLSLEDMEPRFIKLSACRLNGIRTLLFRLLIDVVTLLCMALPKIWFICFNTSRLWGIIFVRNYRAHFTIIYLLHLLNIYFLRLHIAIIHFFKKQIKRRKISRIKLQYNDLHNRKINGAQTAYTTEIRKADRLLSFKKEFWNVPKIIWNRTMLE